MLGTMLHKAFEAVGITPARVEKVTGKPCGCNRRREALDRWTYKAIRISRPSRVLEYLFWLYRSDIPAWLLMNARRRRDILFMKRAKQSDGGKCCGHSATDAKRSLAP